METSTLQEQIKTLDKENYNLRLYHKKYDDRFKNLEEKILTNSQELHSSHQNHVNREMPLEQQVISTPKKRKLDEPTDFQIRRTVNGTDKLNLNISEIENQDETEEVGVSNISLNETYDNPMSRRLISYFDEKSEESVEKECTSYTTEENKNSTSQSFKEKDITGNINESFSRTMVMVNVEPSRLKIDDWVLVVYEGTKFLGRVKRMTNEQAEVLALSRKFGDNEPQPLERDNDAVWYEFERIFESPVDVNAVKVGRKYLWTYSLVEN